MTKISIICFVLPLSMLGCGAADDPSSISVSTIQDAAQLQSIAMGVSEGNYADQHVLYVDSEGGADWLFNNTLREYNDLRDQYARTNDSTLLPRMNYLQNVLKATSDNSGGPFLITSVPAPTGDMPSNVAPGPTCSGGGNDCNCKTGCVCSSNDHGCSCTCSGA